MVCLELGAGSVGVDVNCEGCAGEVAVAVAVASCRWRGLKCCDAICME